MKTININVSVSLLKDEFSPHEKDPEIRVFLDSRFKRTPVTVGLNAQNINISGKINKKTKELPYTTTLVFSAFAWRTNNYNNKCLVDVGVCMLYLDDIVNKNIKSFDVPLLMHTANDYEKGVLRININSHDMQNIKVSQIQSVETDLSKYINSTVQIEQRMKDTMRGTERMRIPLDYSESGVHNGYAMPSDAYILSETPVINTRFLENAYVTVLKRDMLVHEQWSTINKQGKARTTGLICCYVAQYLDYKSDDIDKNKKNQKYIQSLVAGYENFGSGLVTFDDDCDGLGTAIHQTYNALVEHSIDKKSPYYDALIEVQQIAKQYIPLLSLDVVNGAQVSDKQAPLGAHMNVNFMPIHEFRECVGKRIFDQQLSRALPEVIDEELPFMIGEGTGKLECLGYDNKLLPLYSYVYRLRSLQSFKKPISRTRTNGGSFLVGSLTALTDKFIRKGVNIGSLTYATKQKDGTLTRGLLYNDMINERDDIAIILHDKITNKDMNVMKEATMMRDPPHPLTLSEGSHKEREKNEHLDYIVSYIANIKRPKGKNVASRVPIYIRPHQINKDISHQMAYELANLRRVWKVSYSLEKITDEIWGYEMLVFVN